jgi:hypothetical protein
MKLAVLAAVLAGVFLGATGCDRATATRSRPTAAEAPRDAALAKASLSSTAAAQMQAPDVPRRVIRTAELSLEADAPEAVERRVTMLADAKGGFVLSSDTSSERAEDGAEVTTISVVFRVPAATFDGTLQALRALGSRVASEKVTGQDVTEEYVDVEARIKAQRAVEQAYLTMLKDAKTIHDVLEVQQKLGEIRTEIERAEGRLRYLENQTSLSTFTVHLGRQIAAVDASGPGFGASVRKAGHDAVAVSVAIVNGGIRLVGALAPVVLLLGLPAYFLGRLLLRRHRKQRLATSA